MAALICQGCTAVYSVGAPDCPQCGANDPVPDYEATVEQVRKRIAAKTAASPTPPTTGPAPAAPAK